jgi:hypothetical protein
MVDTVSPPVKSTITCPICNKEVKSLNAHKKYAHGNVENPIARTAKKLAEAIAKIKDLEAQLAAPVAALSETDYKTKLNEYLNNLTEDEYLHIGAQLGFNPPGAVEETAKVAEPVAEKPPDKLAEDKRQWSDTEPPDPENWEYLSVFGWWIPKSKEAVK